jgi:hypothetical protein
MLRKLVSTAAIAALLAFSAAPTGALAAITTYHFAEANTDANISSGLVGSFVHNPFAFDFTVANALAASTQYNFGVAGIEPGASGNLLDMRFSDGTPLTTFTLADYHGYEVFGGAAGSTQSRFQLHTDATGAIDNFTIYVAGRNPVNSQTLTYLQFLGGPSGITFQETLYYDPALGFHTVTAGDVHCNTIGHCGGVFTAAPGGIGGVLDTGGGGAAGVPEPAAWALMIAGFGLSGAILRRRRSLAPV